VGLVAYNAHSMLEFLGKPYRHCDGLSRRSFLCAGALGGLGGLTLPDLLRAESEAGVGSSNKAIINIHLDGGPPQMDMIDMKPDAPAELRGEFDSIATTIPGFRMCELMPRLASIADRFAFIRSLVGSIGQHHGFQTQSGFDEKSLRSVGGRPAMGCVISKLMGTPNDPAPAFVDLMQGRPLVRNSARAGFLGPAYGPFRPEMSKLFARPLEDGMKSELAARGGNHTTSLKLIDGLTTDRLNQRTALRNSLDRMRHRLDQGAADRNGMMAAMDRFGQQAVGILTSGRFADAMDLSKEDPRTLSRYTPSADKVERFATSEGPRSALKFLLARRLVEAGVRCVSVSLSDFDTHSNNFPRMRQVLPILDVGLHALVTDLEDRGMLEDVSIVVWGEFGRTPKINKNGGRDHWPKVSIAMLAGGGMKVGQVIGATDRYAGEVTRRPVHFQDVIATLYHNLGINAGGVSIPDTKGTPHFLVKNGNPIKELV
jgi:hypothetical protein